MDWTSFLPGLVTVIVPLVIYFAKVIVPKIPKWLIPILAPILGGVAEAVLAYASGGTPNPALGAVLGAAGTGLREVVDQIKKA